MSYEKEGAPIVWGGGCGFCGLLTIAFIVLKLCGVITWSWWLVLLPMIIAVCLPVAIIIIVFIVCLIIRLIENIKLNKTLKNKNKK